MITKETSRLSAPGYALRSNAAGKTRKTGKESTLKNTVSCIDNPGHFSLLLNTPDIPFGIPLLRPDLRC